MQLYSQGTALQMFPDSFLCKLGPLLWSTPSYHRSSRTGQVGHFPDCRLLENLQMGQASLVLIVSSSRQHPWQHRQGSLFSTRWLYLRFPIFKLSYRKHVCSHGVWQHTCDSWAHPKKLRFWCQVSVDHCFRSRKSKCLLTVLLLPFHNYYLKY